MQKLKAARAAALLVGLALVAAACGGGGGGGGGTSTGGNQQQGVKGGTLRIVNNGDVDYLDTANEYYTVSWQLARTYARELYSYDITKTGNDLTVPVPDMSDGPATVSADNTTFTFKVRKGVKYAPPVNREVTPADFAYAVTRLYDKANPSGGQSYANLIAGAKDFGDGKAKTISGITTTADSITYKLAKPAADFLSIIALPFFAPVPQDYASKYKVGPDYSKHVVGSGPYTVSSYVPNKSIEIIRNTNWDQATDPLRHAWVDKITMKEGLDPDAIQQTIERGDADMSTDTQPPNSALQRLASDPKLKTQFSDELTGCYRYFSLVTNFGPTKNVMVRQAINYALDKVALQRARGGPFAGDPATTILPPTLLGYQKYDLYPSADFKGDVAKAKSLLAQAGFPNGVSISYLGVDAGAGKRVDTAAQASLARAGIKLSPFKELPTAAHYTDELQLPAKRATHEMGQAGWCPDYPGDGARSFVVPLLDGRAIQPSGNSNYSEYDSKPVEAMIDQALAEPDKDKRATLWGQIDKQIMQDAPMAPFLYDKTPYFWSSRVKNWKFTPWTTEPEITALWLDPSTP